MSMKIKLWKKLLEAPKVKVKNVPESSLFKDPYGYSCIGYWEKETECKIGENTVYCCPACGKAMSKKESTLDGAHVYMVGKEDEWNFVPLCSKCNNSENTEPMEVNAKLVPVPPECYEKK